MKVSDCIEPDGGLFSLSWYLCWNVGDLSASLDGEFTATDLREIADHMERTKCTKLAHVKGGNVQFT